MNMILSKVLPPIFLIVIDIGESRVFLMTLTFYRTPLIAYSGFPFHFGDPVYSLPGLVCSHNNCCLVDLIKVTLVKKNCLPGALNVVANDGFGIQESVA